MRNWKVKTKLLTTFFIMAALSCIIGGVSIASINSLIGNSVLLAEYSDTHIELGNVREAHERICSDLYLLSIVCEYEDTSEINSVMESLDTGISVINDAFAKYFETAYNEQKEANFYSAMSIFEGEYSIYISTVRNIAQETRSSEQTYGAILAGTSVAENFNELLQATTQDNIRWLKEDYEHILVTAFVARSIPIAIMVIAAIASVVLTIYLSRIISKPVVFMKDVLMRIGTKGDLEFSDEEYNQIEQYAAIKDEVGESLDMLLSTVRHLVDVKDTLEKVSKKDLTVEAALLSDRDTMGLSLQNVVSSLSQIFGEINDSAGQVAVGSSQVASGAQSLAQGSTEQASVIDELSASISEMAKTTRENADMTDRAAELANTIKSNAENGRHQMSQMMGAIKDINQSSQEISKVINVIDDIAFQTNILALNAAVEAARAGQHGKGFAVVADEVRSLAAKSAEAAKDTSGLIANSIDKVEFGVHIADKTAASLSEIVSGITESSVIVGNIAKSSGEQANTISQINNGVDQVVQVIQLNSATAEQSAAASEELSGQAKLLERLVAQFKHNKSHF